MDIDYMISSLMKKLKTPGSSMNPWKIEGFPWGGGVGKCKYILFWETVFTLTPDIWDRMPNAEGSRLSSFHLAIIHYLFGGNFHINSSSHFTDINRFV